MENDIVTEERIDCYLLGRLSDAEKVAFEHELATNAELKEEYECQRLVLNAVQKVAMKDFLSHHASKRKNKRILLMRRIAWTLTSAAAMIIAIIGSVNYTSTLHSLKINGVHAYEQLSVPISRDGNDLDAMIEEAYRLLGNEDFDQALNTIDRAKEMVLEGLSKDISSDEEEYEHSILQKKYYDLEWYQAIVHMRQGKVIKAQRELKTIAISVSPYADQAQTELANSY